MHCCKITKQPIVQGNDRLVGPTIHQIMPAWHKPLQLRDTVRQLHVTENKSPLTASVLKPAKAEKINESYLCRALRLTLLSCPRPS
jgi:hypothetical protein